MSGRWAAGTVGHALDQACGALGAAGIETARLDARVLMAHVVDRDQAWLIGHADDQLAPEYRSAFEKIVARRAQCEPVAHLTGEREFWSLSFRVTPDTLIPRPDSETLVDAALEQIVGGAPRLLDLGTGSGCLLLAILSEVPDARGEGVDANAGAVTVATENARRLGLDDRAAFRQASWSRDADWNQADPYDMVIANPPYIPQGDLAGLEPDVRAYEPEAALNGGADGLDDYREIAWRLPEWLSSGGKFVGEFGLGQGPAVAEILTEQGLTVDGFRHDAAGRERVVLARRPSRENS